MALIEKLISDINTKYGDNSLMLAKDVAVHPPCSSGSLALDFAIGIGGFPTDRVIEVAGEEGCGKTTLGLFTAAKFLQEFPDRYVVILDLEHKLEMPWVRQVIGDLGGDVDRILYAQPDHMEMATNMYADVVSSGDISMVLLDSIGGAPVKAAMEKDAEKAQVGGSAGAVTKFARLASAYSSKYRTLTFCVNQVRADMEGFRRHMTPGGHGFKHACILRVKLRRSTRDVVKEKVNGVEMTVGHKIFATVIKNQLAAPGRVAEWWFYHIHTPEYGFGIDTMEEIFDLALATKVVTGSGWLSHPALPGGKVQGKRALKELLREDESLRQTIVSETMAALKSDPELLSEIIPIDPMAEEEDTE